MAENPFLGSIFIFAGNFAPQGYALCEGQLIAISQNPALFSILGTTYGGNGTSNFALPDLRGRVPLGVGQGAGLSSYVEGQASGEESHTLNTSELPAHTHSANVVNGARTSSVPGGHLPADGGYYSGAAANGTMASGAIGISGSNLPHNNIQPYLAVNYIIALQGIFPSRN